MPRFYISGWGLHCGNAAETLFTRPATVYRMSETGFRTTGDIMDNPQSVKEIAYSQLLKLGSSGIDCYNDIDMLVVGMYNK